jgi:hypothetical protein
MQENNNYPEWLFADKYRIFFHLLFWILIYLDEVVAIALFGIENPSDYDALFFFILALDIATVYINIYYFIPKFLTKKKYGTFVALAILSVLFNSALSFYLSSPYKDTVQLELNTPIIGFLFRYFDGTFNMVFLAICIKSLKIVAKNQFRITNLENSNLKSELVFLKNQINPHFLFNALNNIYVQTRKHVKEAPESVLLLSELLRYQLYDCSKEKVLLNNELEYLQNYFALERIRHSSEIVNFKVVGNPNGKKIAPFLFIPFLENAIKHGLKNSKDAFIDILFEITEKQLKFVIKNDKQEIAHPSKSGGIGLANVKRRLSLVYPSKHHLSIEETISTYQVSLNLDW